MATSGRGRSSFSESGAGDPVSRLGKQVYHVRKSDADSELFTESVFVYTTKTWWARLTSRTALETYQGTLNHFVALVILTVQTMAAIVVAVSKRAWVVGCQVGRVGVQVGGAVMRAVFSQSRTAGGAVAGGARATGGAIAGSARGVWDVMAGGARATRSVVAGGARATRSAVAGGARATKGAVAGSARLTRRTVARGRASARADIDAVSPPRQVVQPPTPAGQRTVRARPGSRPERPAAATPPARTVAPTSTPKVADRRTQSSQGVGPAQPRGARSASPRQTAVAEPATVKVARPESDIVREKARPTREVRAGSVPGAGAVRHGARRQSAAAATASLKAEQVFAVRAATAKARQKTARKRIGLATRGRQVAGALVSVARVSAAMVSRLLLAMWSLLRRALRLLSPALRWTSRRWQYAAIPVAVSMLALMLTPIGWDVVGGFNWRNAPAPAVEPPAVDESPVLGESPAAVESPVADESPAAIESEPTGAEVASRNVNASEESEAGVSLPKISLPEFSGPLITLPSISLPDFVKGPVEKVDRLLSGALVERGSRVVVADVVDRWEGDEQLGHVLALVLEAELAQGSYVTVPQRERALVLANDSGSESPGLALPASRALGLAARTGSSAVIAGELTVEDSVRVLAVVVHDQLGEEIHRFALEVGTDGLLDVVGRAATRLAVKFGEPMAGSRDDLAPFLTRSLPAAQAYAEARAHLYRSDYRRAVQAAQRAVADDSAFAAAHRLMAEALGLNGQRFLAQRALETAWRFRDRLSERERLRLAADRDALAGRLSEAILGYDFLFSQFRDDAAALKSQAILQEMLGVRGGGAGNLQVAYSIDPVDWPPLVRVAAFLGYRGRIPDVTGRPPADSE